MRYRRLVYYRAPRRRFEVIGPICGACDCPDSKTESARRYARRILQKPPPPTRPPVSSGADLPPRYVPQSAPHTHRCGIRGAAARYGPNGDSGFGPNLRSYGGGGGRGAWGGGRAGWISRFYSKLRETSSDSRPAAADETNNPKLNGPPGDRIARYSTYPFPRAHPESHHAELRPTYRYILIYLRNGVRRRAYDATASIADARISFPTSILRT